MKKQVQPSVGGEGGLYHNLNYGLHNEAVISIYPNPFSPENKDNTMKTLTENMKR